VPFYKEAMEMVLDVEPGSSTFTSFTSHQHFLTTRLQVEDGDT
jgi:hypothetical protein